MEHGHYRVHWRREMAIEEAARPAPEFEPIPGSEITMDADLVLLAMGSTGLVTNGVLESLVLRWTIAAT